MKKSSDYPNWPFYLIIIATIFTVTFCCWAFIPGRITEGRIINKIYEPERTYFNAATKMITTDDEDWRLVIEGVSPARGLLEESIRRQTKQVTKKIYDSYKIGDWIKF